MKKTLTTLVDWIRESNWTKAVETQGLKEDERKKIMDKAKKDLKKEYPPKKDIENPDKEELKKVA